MPNGKTTLPPPDWLTLPEVLEFLDDHSIDRKEGKEALERAFRDHERIRTRGRSRRYFESDLKLKMGRGPWDGGKPDWQRSTIYRPDRYGDYDVTEVDVSRRDLIKWLGLDEPADETGPSEQDPAPTSLSDKELEERVRAIYAKWAARGETFNSKAARTIIPDEIPGLTQSQAEELHAKHKPADWPGKGRPKTL